MNQACSFTLRSAQLARDVLSSADCVITNNVHDIYRALLSPSGTFAQALTVLLTIYVAVYGYRLVLGHTTLGLANVAPHFLKIGIVLALATSWATYQVFVFNLLFHGPEQVANVILRQALQTQGETDTDVFSLLQTLYNRFTQIAGDGWMQATENQRLLQIGAGQILSAALWFSAILMMFATVGMLLVVRIILALLLAIGPLFIAFALFPATRGLTEGWLRTTLRFALAPLFTILLASVMGLVVAPFTALLVRSDTGEIDRDTVIAIFLVILVFTVLLAQSVRLAGSLSGRIQLPRAGYAFAQPAGSSFFAGGAAAAGRQSDIRAARSAEAASSALAAVNADRNTAATSVTVRSLPQPARASAAASTVTEARLGQSHRRLSLPGRQPSIGMQGSRT